VTRVAVVSSMYGGYDQFYVPPQQDIPVEWVMVTDQPSAPAPWRVVTEPRPQLHPRLAGKVAKCNPAWYAPGADAWIWCDANVRVAGHTFARWCLDALGGAQIAMARHPDQPDIAGDTGLSLSQPRYAMLPMREQVACYTAEGFPLEFGNWWTGIVVRAAGCPDLGSEWLAQMTRWTNHDQISLPYVLWKYGVRPADMPQGWAEGRFGFASHGPETTVSLSA
jgi:hypothetical protein